MYQVVSERGLKINQKNIKELVEGELFTLASDCGDTGADVHDEAKWLGLDRKVERFIIASRFEFQSISNHLMILSFDCSVGTMDIGDALAERGIDKDDDEAMYSVCNELFDKKRDELDGVIYLANGEQFGPKDRKNWVRAVVELIKKGV